MTKVKKYWYKTIALITSIFMIVGVVPSMSAVVSASETIITDSLSKDGISINANHFTYYYLKDSYADLLTIPDELSGENQIVVTGYSFPEFRIMSGDALRLDSYGNFSTAEYSFGETKSGTSIVDVVCGDITFEVTVDVINYADYYVEQTVDNYIAENITDSMTTYEKVEKACEFVASYDYGGSASMYGMILHGYGDCWAATDTICYFCDELGIPAVAHSAPNSISSTHYNALVQIDGVNYIVEAGYTGTAPRNYSITARSEYTELSDGTICLNSFTDWSAESFEIPSTYEGKTVTKIGNEAFEYCDNLQQVTIPDTITEIGEKAFAYSGITSIEIPSSVEVIGEQAFSQCNSLESVIMHNDAECGYSVFYSCDSLESFIFPENMQELSLGFLADCYALKNIVLPDSLTYIDSQAFRSYYTTKRNLYIPPSVTEIHEDAFYSTTSGLTIYGQTDSYAETFATENDITFVAVASSAEMPVVEVESVLTSGSCGDAVSWNLDVETGTLTISGTGPMTDYESSSNQPWASVSSLIKKAVIESGVTRIGSYAFMYCSNMTEIEMAEGLVSMGRNVFWGTAVAEMELPESLEYIGFDTYGCSSITHLEIPATVGLYGYTFYNCNELFHVTLGEGRETIPYSMFLDCSNLSWVEIPSSVTRISYHVFSECTALSNIRLPENLESIGYGAFYKCANLKYVIIPKSVESIGEYAFGYQDYDSDTQTGTLYEDFIIYGYQGTEAETYAVENNITFVALDEAGDDVTATTTTEVTTIPEVTTTTETETETTTEMTTTEEMSTCMVTMEEPYISDLYVSNVFQLDYTIDAAYTGSIAWFSSDQTIATVTQDGIVTVCGEGTVTIYAMDINGNKTSVTFTTFTAVSTEETGTTATTIEMTTTTTATTTTDDATTTSKRGDVDKNGEISLNDAYLTLLAYANAQVGLSSDLTDTQESAADIDGDDVITINDAYYILLYYAKSQVGLNPTWEELLNG